MSVYCVYESYEFYVSLMCESYESWLCVCVSLCKYVFPFAFLSSVYINVRLIVFACAVSGPSFAPSSSCWAARIFIDSTL